MTEKRYFKKEYEEQYFIFDSHIINEETISEFEEIDIRLFADSLTGDEVVNRLNELSEENEQLKSTNMEMEDYLGRLEEANINLQIKLQKIRDYAKEDGEIKQGVIEKVILND